VTDLFLMLVLLGTRDGGTAVRRGAAAARRLTA